MPGSRLSGLQLDVLSLYRTVLRGAAKKDKNALLQKQGGFTNDKHVREPKTTMSALLMDKSSSVSYAQSEFRNQASSIRRSDFKLIEYSLRKGHKQIKLLSMPGVKLVGGFHK
mmetsp:Transcript_37875/g.44121  ORF Transcript_37875/g.44121 Transcript_37875/m.44121 type:complete len:113 (-) Transcript_37875:473-811(-)